MTTTTNTATHKRRSRSEVNRWRDVILGGSSWSTFQVFAVTVLGTIGVHPDPWMIRREGQIGLTRRVAAWPRASISTLVITRCEVYTTHNHRRVTPSVGPGAEGPFGPTRDIGL